MSLSMEAFGLLTLENYHDACKDYVHHHVRTDAKYTVSGTARRNQGYTQKGIDRQHELYVAVSKLRKAKTTFGKRYLEEKRKEWEGLR